MPRPIWSGAISFGLVSVPIRLFPAVSEKDVSFHQIDKEGSRKKSPSRKAASRRRKSA